MTVATQHSLELREQLRHHGGQKGWMVLLGPLPLGEELAWIQVVAAADRPVLVILPGFEQQQGEELRLQLHEHGVKGVTLCSELLGAEAGEVCWYRYNDSRQNGTTPPELLQTIWPNLLLESLELRPQRTLAEVLDQWFAAQGQPPEPEGLLWLHAAMATEVLAGAGVWLPLLAAVLVAGTGDNPTALRALLEPACFCAEEVGPQLQLWQKDPLLVLQTERDGLLAQQEALQQAQMALTSERDQLTAERDGLQVRLDQISTELDEILALLDQVSTPSEND